MAGLFPKAEFSVTLWGRSWAERYDHPIEEYGCLREGFGVADFSELEYISVIGNDAGQLLQGLLTHNNLSMKPGDGSPSWMLDSNGKIQDCLWVYCKSSTEFWIQCLPDTAQELTTKLDRYIFMEDVKLKVETGFQTISLLGPNQKVPEGNPSQMTCPHSRCGDPAIDLIFKPEDRSSVEANLQDFGAIPIGFTALQIRSVETMTPWFGVDMEQGKMPLIYGKGGPAISYSKGCFLGQETIAMTRDRGRPPILLCQFSSQTPQVPQAGIQIVKDRAIGTLTSVIFSPEFEVPMALGCIQYTQAEVGNSFQDQNGQDWTITQVAEWKPS